MMTLIDARSLAVIDGSFLRHYRKRSESLHTVRVARSDNGQVIGTHSANYTREIPLSFGEYLRAGRAIIDARHLGLIAPFADAAESQPFFAESVRDGEHGYDPDDETANRRLSGDIPGEQVLLVTGDPGSGFRYIGPVTPNDPDLDEYIETNLRDEYWWYLPVQSLETARKRAS